MQTTQAEAAGRPAPTERIRRLVSEHRELLLYGVIGGSAVCVDFGVFLLLHTVGGVHELTSHAVSVGTAVLFSFALNARYNFRTTDRLATRFASFATVALVGFLIGAVVIWSLVEFSIVAEVAKLISLPLVAGVQFILNSRFTFAGGETQ